MPDTADSVETKLQALVYDILPSCAGKRCSEYVFLNWTVTALKGPERQFLFAR